MSFSLTFRKRRKPKSAIPAPATFPEVDGIQLAALYSSSRIGGDFYDLVRTPSGRLVLLFMDIAGLRESSFEVATQVQSVFRSRASQLFALDVVNECEAISELTMDLSRAVLSFTNSPRCTPAFVASYLPSIGTLTYVNAGHVPGFIVGEREVGALPSTGLPLGLFSHVVHDAQVSVVAEGDAFVVASRGVSECDGVLGEFGIEGIRAALAEAPRTSATELCQSVLKSALEHSEHATPSNDMTTFALLREAHAKNLAHQVGR